MKTAKRESNCDLIYANIRTAAKRHTTGKPWDKQAQEFSLPVGGSRWLTQIFAKQFSMKRVTRLAITLTHEKGKKLKEKTECDRTRRAAANE
jgi:hypothetical protein